MNNLNKLLPYLIGPESSKPLEYNSINNTLYDHSIKKKYDIIDQVPVLLPIKEKENLIVHEIHNKYNTNFRYLDHYQKDAEIFNYQDTSLNKSNSHENKRLHQTIIRKIPKNSKMILDVGCGGGWLANYLKGSEKFLCSMDISTNNPINVLKTFPFNGHTAIVADVYHLPFKENVFDCIIASEIIEHTVDPGQLINGLLRILKPGGNIIITTPYDEKIEYTLCVHCNKPTPLNGHLHSFNELNIISLLKQQIEISYKIHRFSSKFLIKSRSYLIMQFFHFSIWKLLDLLANFIFKDSTRLIINIQKMK